MLTLEINICEALIEKAKKEYKEYRKTNYYC